MSTLGQYFMDGFLDLAWKFGPKLVLRTSLPGEPTTLSWDVKGDPGELKMEGVGDEDKATIMLQMTSLWKLMRRGPVIVRPSADLGRALMDTEIRMPTTAYKQPYEVMGVELPEEVSGPLHPCLVLVWQPNHRIVCAWAMVKTGMTYYLKIGDDLPTIEDRIAMQQGVEDATDYRIMIQGGRLAINACLLASHREVDLSPLPRSVRNDREANNAGLRRRAHEVFQEVRFRDLVVRERPRRDILEGFGGKLPKQRRSGHWKNAAFGPRHSLHRWTWIDEYETRKGEDWPDGPPTTVLR